MFTILLTLAAASLPLPAWNAPAPQVRTDSQRPDAHQTRVLGAAYCAGQPGCRMEFLTVSSGGAQMPVFGRRVPTSVTFGSFSAPGREEALLNLCWAESDSCDGVALLRRERGQWKRIHHTPGVTAQECLKFRRFDGRDALACRGHFVMYGSQLTLVTADSRRSSEKVLLDGNLQNCGKGTATVTRLGDWRKADVNGDGRPDLVVDVNRYAVRSAQCPPAGNAPFTAEKLVRRWAM
ncbi:hypothetical protein [Deinococcus sp. Marseille-Q6407]|uniref:hypothetical protein n=1 Tax=Deinococcus sp. Marseille-Q6407 TaxID=2969223 RepID=UPI0021C05395|nr:hypothetical protein [Deinococcus sp. Marseille-Q6407]